MRSFRHSAIIITLVVTLVASLFIIGAVSSRPPQESKIISEFSARRAAYEQVLTMLSQDEDVEGVASWGIDTVGSTVAKMPPVGGIPAKRYQEYLTLLKEIGASAVSKESELLEVRFLVGRSGFAGDVRHVAVCWMEREPSHTIPSLHAFYSRANPRSPAYVHIDGKWYIWADW